MDNSGLGGGFLLGSSSGFLDLESSIHRHQLKSSMTMTMMNGLEDDPSSSIGLSNDGKVLNPKGFALNFGKGTNNGINMSEDDEEDENLNGFKGKKGSPWQRMKWTDDIVRLLIQVVGCVDDDGAFETVEGLKRKSGALQKKGKWKTVSKIMIAKGCFVSPQQCEDKFNDLNKRYKRLNDILGRGTSCRVVENPSLMDSMPQLSDKMKDDVKKILSSKHLFYKEICAYHNGQRIPNCSDLDLHVQSLPIEKENNINNFDAEENDESNDDESGGEDHHVIEDDMNFWSRSNGQDCFKAELAEFLDDLTKSQLEQREYVMKRMLQVEEERIGILVDAFELKKRQFKWERFCSKKNSEFEISKLENERLILENERMALLLKQKELDLNFTAFDRTLLSVEIPLERVQIDLSKH